MIVKEGRTTLMRNSTKYLIGVGYNSGYSCDRAWSPDEAWQLLKKEALSICEHPEWIVEEARRFAAPEECERGRECCNLPNHAERYRPPHKDLTIYFDEENSQVCQAASGDRLVKEHVRRAFCRLLINAMHRHNIEVNLTVTEG